MLPSCWWLQWQLRCLCGYSSKWYKESGGDCLSRILGHWIEVFLFRGIKEGIVGRLKAMPTEVIFLLYGMHKLTHTCKQIQDSVLLSYCNYPIFSCRHTLPPKVDNPKSPSATVPSLLVRKSKSYRLI